MELLWVALGVPAFIIGMLVIFALVGSLFNRTWHWL